MSFLLLLIPLYCCSLLALAGGSVALARGLSYAVSGRRPPPLWAHRAERRWLLGALITAAAGSLGLLTLPAYSTTSCTQGHSTETRTRAESPDGSVVETRSFTGTLSENGNASCRSGGESLLEANGPEVIPLLTVPVLFTLLPWLLPWAPARPLVEGLAAILLAGQMMVGLSGYGLAFGPGALLMVLAARSALRAAPVP